MAATCSISTGSEAGHPAVYLENDLLAITVLPEKGADIYKFIHKPTGLDLLWKNPVGLWPPGSPPHDGSGGLEFMENYEGCWQELFPSCNEPTIYNGAAIPFHGEVANLAWTYTIVEENADRIAVRFQVETRATTFRLERVMRLERGSTRLTLDETVTNIGAAEQHFVWGHHCVVGGPWLEPGSNLEMSAQTIVTSEQIYEEKTARLEPGQREPWPYARTRNGGRVDLSVIPGPETHSHDDVYLTDLEGEGWISVTNPRLNLTFSLHWDASLFKWIISWQPYGGAEVLPFKAMSYAVGIEPWVNNKPLGAAVEAGEAIALAPGASLSTSVVAEVTIGS
ncbi:MAG: DUF4432 family protein [Burkholderiales bacterium]|nr:DUF4432 family protein [Anaerolineae bacterium]